ncbi:hypothetical protein FS749_009890 [Ceratobasidium sp. UAMH 11750]|nr:hypothetical protein FS749_009890 [Ceratobasidium sp. UAMH 11750]
MRRRVYLGNLVSTNAAHPWSPTNNWDFVEMTITPLKQVVFVAGPSTHVRSGIKLCTRLVEKFPSAFVSMYIFESFIHQSEEYLSTQSRLVRACADAEYCGLVHGSLWKLRAWPWGQVVRKRWAALDLAERPGKPGSVEEIFDQVLSSQFCASFLPVFCNLQKRWNYQRDHMDMAIVSEAHELELVLANALTKPFRPPCAGPPLDLFPKTQNVSTSGDPVVSFLNRAYTSLSMGHLKIIIAEVLAQGFKVAFALSSDGAKAAGLDGDYVEILTRGGNAIFPEWVNQLEVLSHPAILLFLNSRWLELNNRYVHTVSIRFQESHKSTQGDHLTNTIQLTKQHNCGYELFQTCTGAAKSTSLARGGDLIIYGTDEAAREEIRAMLDATRGARGVQQRLNARALGEVVFQSIGKGGSGDCALGELGRAIGL